MTTRYDIRSRAPPPYISLFHIFTYYVIHFVYSFAARKKNQHSQNTRAHKGWPCRRFPCGPLKLLFVEWWMVLLAPVATWLDWEKNSAVFLLLFSYFCIPAYVFLLPSFYLLFTSVFLLCFNMSLNFWFFFRLPFNLNLRSVFWYLSFYICS